MSDHYDCKNCGAHLGINWGYCRSCTPKEYLNLKEELSNRRLEIVNKEKRKHEKYAWGLAVLLTKDMERELNKLKRKYAQD